MTSRFEKTGFDLRALRICLRASNFSLPPQRNTPRGVSLTSELIFLSDILRSKYQCLIVLKHPFIIEVTKYFMFMPEPFVSASFNHNGFGFREYSAIVTANLRGYEGHIPPAAPSYPLHTREIKRYSAILESIHIFEHPQKKQNVSACRVGVLFDTVGSSLRCFPEPSWIELFRSVASTTAHLNSKPHG